MYELMVLQSLTEQQRVLFLSEMQRERKDPTTGVLLALFLGGFGAHRFYMRQTGLGILYLVFFWTGISAIVALIECFLMSGRVHAYNNAKAEEVAYRVRTAFPAQGIAALAPLTQPFAAPACAPEADKTSLPPAAIPAYQVAP